MYYTNQLVCFRIGGRNWKNLGPFGFFLNLSAKFDLIMHVFSISLSYVDRYIDYLWLFIGIWLYIYIYIVLATRKFSHLCAHMFQ